MKSKVYIETSIPSFYYEIRTEPDMIARKEWTCFWWDQISSRYDFLLTWNCRHLANANKFGHIRRINVILGLYLPLLVTPLELMGE